MSKRIKKLSADDYQVWQQVTETVNAYDRYEEDKLTIMENTVPEKTVFKLTLNNRISIQKPTFNHKSCHLNPIERPVYKKIAKGRVPIDARIDLHGMTQRIAYKALYDFINKAYLYHHRHVLVITGKGSSTGGGGILKQVVPQWFINPEFRTLISGFQISARNHGGEGAFYVRLRRKSKPEK